jgi:hypothetical protein
MVSLLTGVVVMGRWAHRAIAGYALARVPSVTVVMYPAAWPTMTPRVVVEK